MKAPNAEPTKGETSRPQANRNEMKAPNAEPTKGETTRPQANRSEMKAPNAEPTRGETSRPQANQSESGGKLEQPKGMAARPEPTRAPERQRLDDE